MARPHKLNAEWFRHRTHKSKTKSILTAKWGNDGYALLFRLYEELCISDYHFIDIRRPIDWQYLCSNLFVPEKLAREIIEFLVELNKLDRELYDMGILFAPKLVEEVIGVWDKRNIPAPTPQSIRQLVSETGVYGAETPVSETETSVNPGFRSSNPTEYIREENSMLSLSNKIYTVPDGGGEKVYSHETHDTPLNHQQALLLFEKYSGNIVGDTAAQTIAKLCHEHTDDTFIEALEIAKQNDKVSVGYVGKILENWKNKGKEGRRFIPKGREVDYTDQSEDNYHGNIE